MLPIASTANSRYRLLAYSIARGQFGVHGNFVGADIDHINLRKFGSAVGSTLQSMLAPLGYFVGRVVRISPKEQMFRVNAGPIIAPMANMEIVKNGAAENLKRHAVRSLRSFTYHDLTIALGFAGHPIPASGFMINDCLRKQPIFKRCFSPSRHERNLQ